MVGNTIQGEVRHNGVFVVADDPDMEKSLQRQYRGKNGDLARMNENIENLEVITKLRESTDRREDGGNVGRDVEA